MISSPSLPNWSFPQDHPSSDVCICQRTDRKSFNIGYLTILSWWPFAFVGSDSYLVMGTATDPCSVIWLLHCRSFKHFFIKLWFRILVIQVVLSNLCKYCVPLSKTLFWVVEGVYKIWYFIYDTCVYRRLSCTKEMPRPNICSDSDLPPPALHTTIHNFSIQTTICPVRIRWTLIQLGCGYLHPCCTTWHTWCPPKYVQYAWIYAYQGCQISFLNLSISAYPEGKTRQHYTTVRM